MEQLNGSKYREFEKALASAFPNRIALERMVRYYLDKDLSQIAENDNLTHIIFELIKWVQTHGRLNELICGAFQENSDNPELKKFHKWYLEEIKDESFQSDKPLTKEVINSIPFHETDSPSAQPDKSSPQPVDTWLKHFHFQRSPFEQLEAGSTEYAEPGFLSGCFVDPDCFRDVLGQIDAPKTVLVFGARGTGKTALRVMIDYDCKHGGVPDKKTGQRAYILSVPHFRWNEIASKNTTQIVSPFNLLEQHIIEILERSMPQFVELCMLEAGIRNAILNVSERVLHDLSWYVNQYGRHLTGLQLEALGKIGIKLSFDSSADPWLAKRKNLSPLDHLEQWCQLIFDIGIKAVYVLVDGLDELETTAADINEAYRLFAPLITNRNLIDKIPHFALKCFLPAPMDALIRSDKKARLDLVPSYYVRWSKDRLIRLLNARVLYFRQKDFQAESSSFAELCVPELYNNIEQELAKTASGNPRHLLKLCDLMIRAHCHSQGTHIDNFFNLTPEDLATARIEFERDYPRENANDPKNNFTSGRMELRQMIENGESQRIELKSSMLRDMRSGQQHDGLIMEIGKEIAAMLNSDGGTLLIGVSDDKQIVGIEADFEFLGQRNKNRTESKKQDLDGYQLKLIDLIKDQMGSDVFGLIEFQFETIDNHVVCAIHIQPSSRPVYFSKTEELYIRTAGSKVKLKTSEILPYIHGRIQQK